MNKLLCVMCLIIMIVTLLPTISAFINRTEWGARPSKLIETIEGVVPYVIIHHSYIPAACLTTEECKKAMLQMQLFHQNDRGWNDIGYTFGIGGDGEIYEGRGFNVVGAHAPKYNDKSVGICFIGDYQTSLPSTIMITAAKNLIAYGVSMGKIDRNYTLLGHRQVRDTLCPGDTLFKEIATWPHFSSTPTGPNDTIKIRKII